MAFALGLLIAFVGFVGGCVAGFRHALNCQIGIELNAMKNGFIRLPDGYYRLTKIKTENDWTVEYDK